MVSARCYRYLFELLSRLKFKMTNLQIFFFLVLFVVIHGCKYKHCSHTHSRITIQQVTEPVEHAEGPHWDYRSQTLYFVDIHKQKIYRFNPANKKLVSAYIENGPVGVAVPVEDSPDQLVAGAGTDFVLVTWDGECNSVNPKIKVLATVDTDRTGTRWNDGKVDSHGRFWGGTIGPEINTEVIPNQASLYRITDNLIPNRELSPVTTSNGLAWNLNDDTFYYIDTPTYQIAAFDYDPHNGTISNRRVAFDLKKNNVTGLPDGMTIDTNGNLWIALYGGSHVIHADPKNGKLIQSIKIPADSVTSVIFGGPLLDILYVTTSRVGLNETELNAQPKAGSVFAVKGLGVRGLLGNSFAIRERNTYHWRY